MKDGSDYKQTGWYRYMEEPMQDLVQETFVLLEIFRGSGEEGGESPGAAKQHDYAFLVFPMAKAYEGFLKKMLLDMGLISKRQYYGEHFRIGRALNPNLPKRYRHGWVYERLVSWCGGKELPDMLWDVWKEARNRIFHFFPDHQEFISLQEAETLIERLGRAMEKAVAGCRLA